jgi:hypothetical protein
MLSNEEIFALIDPPKMVEYECRIYYNESGEITVRSITDHPDGKYIVVDQDTYNNYFRYKIVNNQLIKIDTDAGYRVKLKKSSIGYAVVAGHAGLLLEQNETYNNIEYYERTDH